MKPKLLIVELWGMGDLIIATPFLRAATKEFSVTLVAKPYAQGLRDRFWPEVQVVPFVAPWTAFTGKYRLHRWPWRGLTRLRRLLAKEKFDFALSARWDPRDHFLLWLTGARERLGFHRMGSRMFLTQSLSRPDPRDHRYEYWCRLGSALGLTLPKRHEIPVTSSLPRRNVLVHTGAGQAVRVWPLDSYRQLVARLRGLYHPVVVACDPDQREWWLRAGEAAVATPKTVGELLTLLDQAGVFVGNDSGPGHLAAFCGVPTLTLFGPQIPEWFSPLHPETVCIEGKPCPYKPCSDYCRFPTPYCLQNITEAEVWLALERMLNPHTGPAAGLGGR